MEEVKDIIEEFPGKETSLQGFLIENRDAIESIICYSISEKARVITCYPFAARYVEIQLKRSLPDSMLNVIEERLSQIIEHPLSETSHPRILEDMRVICRIEYAMKSIREN